MTGSSEVKRMAAESLADYLLFTNQCAGGTIELGDGYLVYIANNPNPHPYLNGVLCLGGDERHALERAESLFEPLRRSFAIWIRREADADLEQVCLSRGYWRRPPEEGLPIIVTDRPLGEPARATRLATAEQDFDGYLRTVGDAWDVPDAGTDILEELFISKNALRSERAEVHVAELDGEIVAGTFVLHGPVAGIYYIASKKAARGHGLGTATLLAATKSAFDRGSRLVTAQGSQQGTPLWVRCGYRIITHWRRYVARPIR